MLVVNVPFLKATYTLNSRMHWAQRSRVVRAERLKVALAWRAALPAPVRKELVEGLAQGGTLVVRLVRIGPRRLDSDNTQGSMKSTRDQVAHELEVNDNDPRIAWDYDQEPGEYAVRIEIEAG